MITKKERKRQIHIRIPELLLTKWIINRDINDGDMTQRIVKLIELDSYVDDDDKKLSELQHELNEVEEQIKNYEIQRTRLLLEIDKLKRDEEKQDDERLVMAKHMRNELQEALARGV